MTSPQPSPYPGAFPVGIPHDSAPGALVGGRYVLAARIACGGMGDVWRAHDQVRDRPVALKLLRHEYLEEPAFLARFRAECRLAGRLEHPNIAAIFDYGERTGPGGTAWLAMELVEGEPLSRLLARRGPLQPDEALDIVGHAACALQAAHDAGVVHRDVKPGNMLVTPDGIVKITDFGIARATGAAPLTRTGTVLGTAHYLSPEQTRGQAASPASDVYALGVVAYECLTGVRPYEADSPVEVALAHQREPIPPLPEDIPGPVVALVRRALAKEPSARPASAGSLGRTALGIRAALYLADENADENAEADPTSRPFPGAAAAAAAPATAPLHIPRRRHRRRAAVLGGFALVLAIVVGVWVGTATTTAGGTAATRPAAAPPPTVIVVDPLTYRGQPAALALTSLRALGLLPRRVDISAQGAAGTVVTIVGSGGGPLPATLPRGAQVVVEVVAS